MKTISSSCTSCREPQDTDEAIDDFMDRVAKCFARAEPRRTARLYLEALLKADGRKTAAQIANYIDGASSADAVRRLLGSARWNADELRDELLRATSCRVGHAAGTLVLHHYCFQKSGVRSVGVGEHYCPRLRRTGRSQVAVLATFEVDGQSHLVDRELFLPRAWAEDQTRRQDAGVPGEISYLTLGEIAARIVQRCSLFLTVQQVVVGMEFNDDSLLDEALDAASIPHLLEMSDSQIRARIGQYGNVMQRRQADAIDRWFQFRPTTAPRAGWDRIALARPGAKRPAGLVWSGPSVREFGDVLSGGASLRRANEYVEEACADLGFDSYECRRWTSWYRHVTLAFGAMFCRGESSD